MVDHHFEGHADRVFHAQYSVAEGVAHKDQVNAGLISNSCGYRIIGGEAYDRTGAFECANGPGGGLHRDVIRLRGVACKASEMPLGSEYAIQPF